MAWTWGRGYSSSHLGVDLVAPTGTPIRALRGGVVTYAGDTRQDRSPPWWSSWSGRSGAAGIATAIDVGDGLTLLYVHQSRLAVARGQRVDQGQLVGYVGATGYAFGAHLHLAAMRGSTFVDPVTLWSRAQLLALVAGQVAPGGLLVDAPAERTPDQALAQLQSIGISTARDHVFTRDEANAIATRLYKVSGSVAESIARTIEGRTVQWWVDAYVLGTNTSTSLDPFGAVAAAIAGIPDALGGLLWLAAILALILLGLYVTLSAGGSES